jgi:hypothetical protein
MVRTVPEPVAAGAGEAQDPVPAGVAARPDFRVGGGPYGAYELALDQVIERDADGCERTVRVAPPATRATLAARLAGLGPVGKVLPVAWPVEGPRDAASRRLVTPGLRVRAAAAVEQALAAAYGLVVVERPTYAPEWVLLEAPGPLAALTAQEKLRRDPRVAEADVLLAARRFRRALPDDPLFPAQWHLHHQGQANALPGTDINVAGVWNFGGSGLRGTGIRIGILDDGLQTDHPDLSGQCRYRQRLGLERQRCQSLSRHRRRPRHRLRRQRGRHRQQRAGRRRQRARRHAGRAAPDRRVGDRRPGGGRLRPPQRHDRAQEQQLGTRATPARWSKAPGPLTKAALQHATATGRGGKGTIFLWAGGNGGNVGDNSNYDGYANSIHTIAIGASDSAGHRSAYSEPGANLVVCAPSSGVTGITTTDRTGSSGYNGSSSAATITPRPSAARLRRRPTLPGWSR